MQNYKMENAREREVSTLISELIQGKQLVNQLKDQFDPSTTPPEKCEFLVQKILSSYEKALSMLKWDTIVVGEHQCTPSPSSDQGSERYFKDQSHKNASKKRKTLSRWTEQVRVCSGTGLEGPLEDGYSWRKYGQKDILGAKFPRAYYRCTHRHAQGCLATKQVQRSDQDPSIFEITYQGRHTCMKSSKTEGRKPIKNQHEEFLLEEKKEHSEYELFNFVTSLKKFKTEDSRAREDIFPSFSLPSTPVESKEVEDYFLPESLLENTFMGSYSQAFTTSESNYFDFGNMGSEPDLTEIVSAPSSGTSSPIGDLDFSILNHVDFDPKFAFDIESLLNFV